MLLLYESEILNHHFTHNIDYEFLIKTLADNAISSWLTFEIVDTATNSTPLSCYAIYILNK